LTIAGYGLREALRRKVFVVVCFLSVAFLGLYWLGVRYAFHHVANVVPPAGVDSRTFAGAFLFGMAMFGTLFLGVVLAIFRRSAPSAGTRSARYFSRWSCARSAARACSSRVSWELRPCACRTS
jgi:hypothetical protein